MKNQLLKKRGAGLSIGMGLTISAMLFSASANAQIIYTDVNPDVSINTNGGVYALDLNNDGITDFNITYATTMFAGQTNKFIRITPLGANKVGNDLSYPYPSALLPNTLIDASSFSWLSTANQSLISRIWFQVPRTGAWIWQNRGNWNGASNKYVPLQLSHNSQKFYGWARLDAATNAVSFTVKDYAYNSIPNQPIRAGETSCATPTVNLTQSGSLSFCNGDSVTFTANGTGYQYQWKRNGVNIAGATAKTYVAKTAGIYKCKVTNSCGSKTSGTRTVTVPCRTTEDNVVQIGEQLSVYPNPATDQLNLDFPFTEGDAIITVLNSLGQTLLKQSVTRADEAIQVNVQDLSEGLYFITVQNGERAFNARFLKK